MFGTVSEAAPIKRQTLRTFHRQNGSTSVGDGVRAYLNELENVFIEKVDQLFRNRLQRAERERMIKGDVTANDFPVLMRRKRSRSLLARAIPCAAALTISTSAGLWLLYASAPAVTSPGVESLPRSFAAKAPDDKRGFVSGADGSTPAAAVFQAIPPLRQAMRLDPSVIAPDYVAGYRPVTFAQVVSLRSSLEPPRSVGMARLEQPSPADAQTVNQAVANPSASDRQGHEPRIAELNDTDPEMPEQIVPLLPPLAVQTVPVPTPRPVLPAQAMKAPPIASSRRLALSLRPDTPDTPAPRSFFDRMFRPAEQPNTALAYAAPEDGGLGLMDAVRAASSDRYTAVYDIAAHMVTLPDGTRLEAHSGLGAKLDDPRSVAEHMRGATPPAIYELSPREALFHGVAALRLNPVAGTTYGRAGLLAHTFMLGPRGDSNGCVVFRDYNAFRRAFDTGAVKRLVVVARSK